MYKNRKSLVVDLDGTLCPIKETNQSYEDLVPYKEMVNKIKEWKIEGFAIVIFTARNMKTYEGNLGLINANTARKVTDWLDKWDIPYDEILFGKPWPGERGYYVDDRAIRPDEFIKFSENELDDLLSQSKKSLVQLEEKK